MTSVNALEQQRSRRHAVYGMQGVSGPTSRASLSQGRLDGRHRARPHGRRGRQPREPVLIACRPRWRRPCACGTRRAPPGRATIVPFTAVLTGPQRTTTDIATGTSTCGAPYLRRSGPRPIWLWEQVVGWSRLCIDLAVPAGRSVPGRGRPEGLSPQIAALGQDPAIAGLGSQRVGARMSRPRRPGSSASTAPTTVATTMMNADADSQLNRVNATPRSPYCCWLVATSVGK
jgi:hypothetical protein